MLVPVPKAEGGAAEDEAEPCDGVELTGAEDRGIAGEHLLDGGWLGDEDDCPEWGDPQSEAATVAAPAGIEKGLPASPGQHGLHGRRQLRARWKPGCGGRGVGGLRSHRHTPMSGDLVSSRICSTR
ncbi:hypothetical protein OIE68_00730 [Nocardia vinacea]|uniref:hypothetical protein n=1 Tax=Nocardia vinacea TaxID=96468 RepID=UPI002E0E1D68|nr:hypothetical protein OIE68_00730 [Nocardia vinacea]